MQLRSFLQKGKKFYSNYNFFPSNSSSNALLYGIIGVNTLVFYAWHKSDSNRNLRSVLWKHFVVSKSKIMDRHQYHTLFTATISHQSLSHYIGNMVTLYFFGTTALSVLGNRHFALLYFGGGIISSLGQILIDYYNDLQKKSRYTPQINHLGASGGVISVLTWTILSFPKNIVMVYFIIPVPAILFGVLYLIHDIYGLYDVNNRYRDGGVSYGAHLVGTAYGGMFFALLKYRHRILRRW